MEPKIDATEKTVLVEQTVKWIKLGKLKAGGLMVAGFLTMGMGMEVLGFLGFVGGLGWFGYFTMARWWHHA